MDRPMLRFRSCRSNHTFPRQPRVLQPCHAGRSSGGHRACGPSDRGGHRPRSDGDGLSRSSSGIGAPGSAQGVGSGARRRRSVPGAVHPGVPGRRRARSSQRRHRVRRRGGRRRPVPLDAIRGGDRPRAAPGSRGIPLPRGRGLDRRAMRSRARRRARRGTGAPRRRARGDPARTRLDARRPGCSSPTSASRSTWRRAPG